MTQTWPEVRIGIGLVTAEVPPGSAGTTADEYAGTLRIAGEGGERPAGARDRARPDTIGARVVVGGRPVVFDLIGGARS